MLSFLDPLALLALSALLIPLLIHLWERRRARVIRVGSIRWLAEGAEARVSRLRFSDLWRFLLRACIVALGALLLAGPQWQAEPAAPAGQWVLVDPEAARHPRLIPRWDSLVRAGQTVKVLMPPFPDWAADGRLDTLDVSPWVMLQDLALSGTYPDTVTVFSTGRLAQWTGPRPTLPFAVRWRFLPVSGRGQHLLAAWRQDDRVRWFAAGNGSEGLAMEAGSIAARPGSYPSRPGLPALRLQASPRPAAVGADSLWTLQWQDDPASRLIVVPRPRRTVVLVADKEAERGGEARVLSAALAAVSEFLDLPMETRAVADGDPIPAPQDAAGGENTWLFWVSAAELPQDLAEAFDLRVLAVGKSEAGTPLRLETTTYGWALRGDLLQVEDNALPERLVGLLFGNEIILPATQDGRQLDLGQAGTRYAPATGEKDKRMPSRRSLFAPLWVLVLILFGLERFWAGR